MSIEIIIYFTLSLLIIFISAITSYKLNLTDLPNNRKIHSKATAYTGGISISVVLLIALFIFDLWDKYLSLILSMSFLISIVGFIDDKYNLNTGGKLSLQTIPIFYLVVLENLTLSNIGNYNYFIIEIGNFVIPFSLLCVLFLINSFNYFDGMDGTLCFTTISVLFILFILAPNYNFKLFLMILFIPIAIFLCFNFSLFNLPKLFLGDSGSLLLGFIISFILIYLSKENIVHPILLAWSIAIFVYEFLSINLIRLKRKKDPFKPGQDHLHHILYSKIKSIFFTNLIIFTLNIVFFIIGYISFRYINPLASLLMFVSIFFIFLIVRNKYTKPFTKIKII